MTTRKSKIQNRKPKIAAKRPWSEAEGVNRRGAPIGNDNARKHGLYAAHRPHPILHLQAERQGAERLARIASKDGDLDLVQAQIHALEESLFQSLDATRNMPKEEVVIRTDHFLHTVRACADLKLRLRRQLLEKDLLPSLAAAAPSLFLAESPAP